MHQLQGLLKPATSPVPAPSNGSVQASGDQAQGNDFSRVLASSSGAVDDDKKQRFTRVSEQRSSDEHSAQLKDDWLNIIEDLNSSEEEASPLKVLLKQHEISSDELAQLLAELEGLSDEESLAALVASVQSGNKLPAASLQQLESALAELDDAHPLQPLLADIEALQASDKEAVLAELAQILGAHDGIDAKSVETEHDGTNSIIGKGDQVSAADKLDELIQSLSDEDAELLLAWLDMQDALAQLDQQGEVRLTAEERALLEQMIALQDYVKASLADLLESYGLNDSETGEALSQLREQLANWLQRSEEGAEPGESELETGQQLAAQLMQLLHQLKQQESEAERSTTRPGLQANNQLPAVAAAIGQAAQQLREQLQAALQQQATEADSDEQSMSFEQIRRLMSDVSQVQQGDNRTLTSQGQPQAGSNVQFTAAASNVARDATQAQQAATQQQSAYEAARQAQQAIDILGPQAPERLRERVAVMFNSRTQAAEMRLDPPDLGRLNIRLNMNQEQASVSFQVTNPQAREAIEQSLPRLRELLAEQGIELADANVSEQQSNAQGDGGDGESSGATAGRESAMLANDDTELEDSQVQWVETPGQSSDGRVDYFV